MLHSGYNIVFIPSNVQKPSSALGNFQLLFTLPLKQLSLLNYLYKITRKMKPKVKQD